MSDLTHRSTPRSRPAYVCQRSPAHCARDSSAELPPRTFAKREPSTFRGASRRASSTPCLRLSLYAEGRRTAIRQSLATLACWSRSIVDARALTRTLSKDDAAR